MTDKQHEEKCRRLAALKRRILSEDMTPEERYALRRKLTLRDY